MMSSNKLINSIFFTLLTIFCSSSQVRANEPSLTFSPNTITSSINSTFVVPIIVDTADYASGGVGAIILYDPFMVTPISIQTGKIFGDYPISSINNISGKIIVSGIAASSDSLFSGVGELATIVFRSNQPGSSTVSFLFEPNNTRDSNIAVTFGQGDILSKVNKLVVTINAGGGNITSTPIQPQSNQYSLSYVKHNLENLLSSLNIQIGRGKYASARTGRFTSKTLSPLDPIISQPPITDPYNSQPIAAINAIASSTASLLKGGIIAIVGLFILATCLIAYKISERNFTISG